MIAHIKAMPPLPLRRHRLLALQEADAALFGLARYSFWAPHDGCLPLDYISIGAPYTWSTMDAQVGPTVNEDKLINAFREYGVVTGWKFLRRSNCAFIDFETPASATAALEALHGVSFSGCQIRIEFKDERGNSLPSFGGRGPPPRRGRLQPASLSPNDSGWLPPHRSLGPRACSSPIRCWSGVVAIPLTHAHQHYEG